VINLRLALDLDMTVTSFFVTFGRWTGRHRRGGPMSPRRCAARATRNRAVRRTTAQHFFGGPPRTRCSPPPDSVEGSAAGVGDIATRVKVNLTRSSGPISRAGGRALPHGSADDLLGSGHLAARGLGILSARFGAFSPHANIGYLFRAGSSQTARCWQRWGSITSWPRGGDGGRSGVGAPVGDSKLPLPGPVTYDLPFVARSGYQYPHPTR